MAADGDERDLDELEGEEVHPVVRISSRIRTMVIVPLKSWRVPYKLLNSPYLMRHHNHHQLMRARAQQESREHRLRPRQPVPSDRRRVDMAQQK